MALPVVLNVCETWSVSEFVLKSHRPRWAGYIVRVEEGRTPFGILMVHPFGRSPVGGPRRQWVGNISRDNRDLGFEVS